MFNLEFRDYLAILSVAAAIGLAIDRWVHRQELEGTGLKREFLYMHKQFDDASGRLSKAMGEITRRIFDIEQNAAGLAKEVIRLRTIIEHWPSRQTPKR